MADFLRGADQPIQVVVRSSKSGTTEIFKSALDAFSPTWVQEFSDPSDAVSGSTVWPVATVSVGDGNEGVAALVAMSPFSIGYVVSKQARDLNLPVAMIGTPEARVQASLDSVSLALGEKGLTFDNPSGLPANAYTTALVNPTNPFAWPIAGYTYLAVRTRALRPGTDCRVRYNLVQFWEWFWTSAVSTDLQVAYGFAFLPDEVRDAVLDAFTKELTCSNETVYFNPMKVTRNRAFAFAPDAHDGPMLPAAGRGSIPQILGAVRWNILLSDPGPRSGLHGVANAASWHHVRHRGVGGAARFFAQHFRAGVRRVERPASEFRVGPDGRLWRAAESSWPTTLAIRGCRDCIRRQSLRPGAE